MAPHPFTTIDPNIGYALVPAPPGSCPEDDDNDNDNDNNTTNTLIGSTHGRDPQGRRLIAVLLKDVAGLVPGAYQGRGRGNKFLNDLTDATVLVHVVDSSGRADAEGNVVVVNDDDEDVRTEKEDCAVTGSCNNNNNNNNNNRPLQDLAWIRKELMEWVFNNLMYKWDTVKRKGRFKVSLCGLVV